MKNKGGTSEFLYSISSWDDLSKDQLYDILQLRQKVFVVEQDCPYLDADGKDQNSYHVCLRANKKVIGYTRLLPLGLSYSTHTSIGRVILDPSQRGTGQGYQLMEFSIKNCKSLWPEHPGNISAQEHLQNFYTKCGFTRIGESYLEDDIPHVAMVMQ